MIIILSEVVGFSSSQCQGEEAGFVDRHKVWVFLLNHSPQSYLFAGYCHFFPGSVVEVVVTKNAALEHATAERFLFFFHQG